MKLSIIEPGGLNIELAILFAANGHDVGYFTEYREAFPRGDRQSLGSGSQVSTNLTTSRTPSITVTSSSVPTPTPATTSNWRRSMVSQHGEPEKPNGLNKIDCLRNRC